MFIFSPAASRSRWVGDGIGSWIPGQISVASCTAGWKHHRLLLLFRSGLVQFSLHFLALLHFFMKSQHGIVYQLVMKTVVGVWAQTQNESCGLFWCALKLCASSVTVTPVARWNPISTLWCPKVFHNVLTCFNPACIVSCYLGYFIFHYTADLALTSWG